MTHAAGSVTALLLFMVILLSTTTRRRQGLVAQAQAHPIGGGDEQVEGCFNDFAAAAAFPLGPATLNNLRCQALCTEQGYALAATGGGARGMCWCGNEYPGMAHAVATNLCDRPCNPDKASCYLFTCCGDRNGTLFTVGWSGETDPMKQVLRRLTHDYRNSTAFRRRVAQQYFPGSTGEGGGAGRRTSLRRRPPHPARPDNAPPLYLGMSDGCPVGWRLFQTQCYKEHWADPSTYTQARRKCQAEGADLVIVTSAAENQFVQGLQGGSQGWLHAHSFLAGGPSAPCRQMARDGSWVVASCDDDHDDEEEERASCFVCEKPRAAAGAALVPYADEAWLMDVVQATSSAVYPWCCDCFDAFLQNAHHQQYLCADDQDRVYMSSDRDPAWCLWTVVVETRTGALALLTPHGAVVAQDDGASTGLACRPLPWTWPRPRAHPRPPPPPALAQELFAGSAGAPEGLLALYPSFLPLVVAERYVRIAIHSINRRRRSPEPGGGGGPMRECSMAVLDTSPRSESFACRPLSPNDDAGLHSNPLVFRQVALRAFDQSTYVTAREPLPNGRVTCVNQNPVETASCVFAYGQALILVRRFRANFGVLLLDTVTHLKQVTALQGVTVRYPTGAGAGGAALPRRGGGGIAAAGGGPRAAAGGAAAAASGMGVANGVGGGGRNANQLQFTDRALKQVQNSLTVAFNTFYQVINLKLMIEVRNWQVGVNTAPLTALTIQFWLTTHYLRFRWRAVFSPRGGFVLSLFGHPLGGEGEEGDACFSLGDLSASEDLFFSMYGEYEEPVEASLTLSDSEHFDLSYLGLPLQPYSKEGN